MGLTVTEHKQMDEPINIVRDRVRFLCEHKDGRYSLYMGNGMYRYFDDESLPAELKTLLGLINATDWEALHRKHYMLPPQPLEGSPVYETLLWVHREYYPLISHEIGWRMADRYALIVPTKSFLELKGDES